MFDKGDFFLYCFFNNFPNFSWFIFCQIWRSFPSSCLCLYLAVRLILLYVVLTQGIRASSFCPISKKSITCLIKCLFSLRNTLHWTISIFTVRCVWFVNRLWERRSPNTVKAWFSMNSVILARIRWLSYR